MKLDFLRDFDFFTGVPDSQLRPLCDYLMDTYGISRHHIIAANEGNAAALATGYHLATGRVPVVYMQNSGEGNAVNPLASLMNREVYGIPCLFIIGWRGEPGVHDEPQHIYQGKITCRLLEELDIAYLVIDAQTTEDAVKAQLSAWKPLFAQGKQAALVVRKGALEYDGKPEYRNENAMLREDILRHILAVSGGDPIVCTTGKASRELFELRAAAGQGHEHDFLTVGSMGHSSSIALGIALQRPGRRVWCIDGDGAALMHLGAMAVIGASRPENLIHILINNAAHETVGGMPTVAGSIDLKQIAQGCGYPWAVSVGDFAALDEALTAARSRHTLSLIEVKSAIGARSNLGRPTTTPQENKQRFMAAL